MDRRTLVRRGWGFQLATLLLNPANCYYDMFRIYVYVVDMRRKLQAHTLRGAARWALACDVAIFSYCFFALLPKTSLLKRLDKQLLIKQSLTLLNLNYFTTTHKWRRVYKNIYINEYVLFPLIRVI